MGLSPEILRCTLSDHRTWLACYSVNMELSGTPSPAAVRRSLVRRLPQFGDPELESVELAVTYGELVALSVARLRMLGEMLAEQLDEEGYEGLIGHRFGIAGGGAVREGNASVPQPDVLLPISEECRALVALEAAERDRCAQLIKDAVKLGLKAQQVDVLKRQGEWVALALQHFSMELGVDWSSEGARRAAQRAVLRTRASLGVSTVQPAAAGPALTEVERREIRGPR